MPSNGIQVRKAASTSPDAATAVREVHAAIAAGGDPGALTVLYCSPRYDLAVLGREIRRLFGEGPVIGCTTAGEITPVGYLEGSLTGVSISGGDLVTATVLVEGLRDFALGNGDAAAQRALAMLREQNVPAPTSANTFGFLLVDGVSMREEMLVTAIYRNLGSIQLFGGSAGDGTRYAETYLYHDGEFRADCALFTLVHTTAPFHVFKTEHFIPTGKKMVVTGADPARRTITELNGEPAALEYARLVGVDVKELTPFVFARHPVVVSVGNTPYVRSIQTLTETNGIKFACAIDEGLVLTLAQGVDILTNLENAFQAVRERIGEPVLVLGCDCILRFLEVQEIGVRERVGEILVRNNVVGFATYGEQYNAMHVNQTFTAVALGSGDRRADA
jgi:hypothetical protein